MNWYFVSKCLLSGLIVGVVSELGRRSPGLAAIAASLPLTSILALIWLYRDTGDLRAVTELSLGIALVVLPSLVFFLALNFFVKMDWGFWPSLGTASVAMSALYLGYVQVLQYFSISL